METKPVKYIVNGKEQFANTESIISYEDVLVIAGFLPNTVDCMVHKSSPTDRKISEEWGCYLHAGESIEIENNMTFTVTVKK